MRKKHRYIRKLKKKKKVAGTKVLKHFMINPRPVGKQTNGILNSLLQMCCMCVQHCIIPFNPLAHKRCTQNKTKKKLHRERENIYMRAESSRQINTKRNYSFCVSNNFAYAFQLFAILFFEGITFYMDGPIREAKPKE